MLQCNNSEGELENGADKNQELLCAAINLRAEITLI